MSAAAKCRASYVLPLRWRAVTQTDELARYLRRVSEICSEVIVVDGSPPQVFEANAAAWGGFTTHRAPDADTACKMGKVAGVLTGVRHARHERIVLADDDVRYDRASLERVIGLLDGCDLVRPQNYFDPLPWHARWDTARTLLNRAVGGDFPGTFAVRRSRILAMGGYDGDVIFENLELMRTIRAHGGRTLDAPYLYVRRAPPEASHFWGQRTRQAYDDFAIPLRMACWLALLPALAVAIVAGRPAIVAAGAAIATLLAEYGRRRSGGANIFPAVSSALAPLWLLERGVCAWLAVLQRVRLGGVRYQDQVIRTAAHSQRELRRRLAPSSGWAAEETSTG